MRAGQPSETARRVAAYRLHVDRIPWPAGDPTAEERLLRLVAGDVVVGGERFGRYLSRRTRFVDEAVVAGLTAGVRQVLTVGAGYDGRSFRYGGPGIRWIELDHPATTAEKRRVLAAAAIEPTAVTVEVDLETADLAGAVTAAGWQATEPALFLCEGVTPYLTPATVDRTLAALRTLAGPGSTLVLDLALVPDTAESERERADLLSRVTAVGEPFRCVVERVAVPRLLARAGWRVGTAVDPAGVELQASAARTVFVAADPAVESIP